MKIHRIPIIHVYLMDVNGKKAPFILTFFGLSKKEFMKHEYLIDQTLRKRGLADYICHSIEGIFYE